MLDVKKDLETPGPLAFYMMQSTNTREGMLVLEPSAGRGVIVERLRALHCKVWAIDNNEGNIDLINRHAPTRTWCMDFRDWHRKYSDPRAHILDRVVMHPPSANNDDIRHTVWAYKFLKVDGVLASIVSETAFSAKTRESEAFKTWLTENDADVEPVPLDMFEAQGVKAYGARMVFVRKWST